MSRTFAFGGLGLYACVFSLCVAPVFGGDLITGPEPIEAGPHHRVMRQVWREIDPKGQPAMATNWYVELATGLNCYDESAKRWVKSKAEFELARSGHFIARQTQYKVILSPNPGEKGAVDLLSPDGIRLRSTILGVAVVDPASGASALLAQPKQSKPQWTAPNQVIYPDAFDDIEADVRYTIGPEHFEQDLILRQQIPPELIFAVGMDPRTARIVVLTEFFDPPPIAARGQGARADRTIHGHEEISFGAMNIGIGRAFSIGTGSGSDNKQARVGRSWELLDGRRFLVEYVDYPELAGLMEGLPAPGDAQIEGAKSRVRRSASTGGLNQLPARPEPVRNAHAAVPEFRGGTLVVPEPARQWSSVWDEHGLQTASVGREAGAEAREGVVLDYLMELGSGLTNYVFKADTTYHVTGTVNLIGTTTFEGGAVIKFAPGLSARLVCYGPVECRTELYRPAVFTARDDNTIGELIAGSTGNPWTNYYANPALLIRVGGQLLQHIRILHAYTGLVYHYYSAIVPNSVVAHCQFVRCNTSITANGYGQSVVQYFKLRNVLIDDTATAVSGYNFDGRIEHLTLHNCGVLANSSTGSVGLWLTNSLLVAVTNAGNVPISQSHCQWASSSNGVFQTVGAGGFYLANEQWRNAGTTNIDPILAGQLKRTTTRPPVVLSELVTTDTRLVLQAARDTDLPDLGYHYPPIDYAVGSLVVTNNGSLALGPGVAVAAFGNHGLRIENYGSMRAEGLPTAPVRLFRYNVVQEQPLDWGNTTCQPCILTGPAHDTLGGEAPPVAALRFAEFSGMGGAGHHLYTDNGWFVFKKLWLQDCVMWGGKAQYSGTTGSIIGLTNNLFIRTSNRYYAWPQLSAYNNLFWGGSNRFERFPTGAAWVFRDNAFHDAGMANVNASVINDHNAYIGAGQSRLGSSGGGDILLDSFTYTNGVYGRFYHHSSNLVNAGSRNAPAAGLYHHTVRPDQSKEESTQVDIGFHYVAADPNGTPLDRDGDGLPDYFEDCNGNGQVEAGETNWTRSDNGTSSPGSLEVFTRLD